VNGHERVKTGTEPERKERRWSLVRESMRKEGLAAIIVYGDTLQWVPIRYLTNIFRNRHHSTVVVFSQSTENRLLDYWSPVEFVAKRSSWLRPENIHFSVTWVEDLAKHLIAQKLQNERIGMTALRHGQCGHIGYCEDYALMLCWWKRATYWAESAPQRVTKK